MLDMLEPGADRVATWPERDRGGVLVVGRLPDCHVVIEHPSVSKRHAVLRWDEPSARATIEDVGSKNGTFVNGAKQDSGQAGIEDGDTVNFGDVAFSYMLAETLFAKLEQMPTSPSPAPADAARRRRLGAVSLQSRLKRMHASTMAGLPSEPAREPDEPDPSPPSAPAREPDEPEPSPPSAPACEPEKPESSPPSAPAREPEKPEPSPASKPGSPAGDAGRER
jgi:hypothetical protein